MTPDDAERAAVEAVEELLAEAALRDAEEPHTILVREVATGSVYAYNVYPSAYAAAEDLVKVRCEATTDSEGDDVVVSVIPLFGTRGLCW